jgi:hypothetical protein
MYLYARSRDERLEEDAEEAMLEAESVSAPGDVGGEDR